MQNLEKKLRHNQRQMAELREKYLVLESLLAAEKNKDQSAAVESPTETPDTEIIAANAAQENAAQADEARPELPAGLSFQNEHYMYAKVIESYRRQDGPVLQRVVEMFLKSFPTSVHADNALYLLGRYYLQQHQTKKAIDTFDSIEAKYPFANKRPAEKLAKAVALKQMRLFAEARTELEQLIEIFPGSQEAFLAKTELQLLQAGG